MKGKNKTKLSQLEKQFSDLAKDVIELKKESLFTSVSCRKCEVVDVEEVKSELIVGEWYKNLSIGNLVYYKSNYQDCYGFSYYHNVWANDLFLGKAYNWTKATPQEVQTALENEAKKRGFVNEVTFIPLNGDKEVTRNGNSFGFIEDTSQLLYGNYLIFQDGIWAEIQQETIKEEEIDFSVSQLLIGFNDDEKYLGSIIMSNGKHDFNNFEGYVIKVYGGKNNNFHVGEFCDTLGKKFFKPFKGELTIK